MYRMVTTASTTAQALRTSSMQAAEVLAMVLEHATPPLRQLLLMAPLSRGIYPQVRTAIDKKPFWEKIPKAVTSRVVHFLGSDQQTPEMAIMYLWAGCRATRPLHRREYEEIRTFYTTHFTVAWSQIGHYYPYAGESSSPLGRLLTDWTQWLARAPP